MIEQSELVNLLAGNSGFSTKRCVKTAQTMLAPLNKLIDEKLAKKKRIVKKTRTEDITEPLSEVKKQE